MLIGYARTSTIEQEAGLEAQERDLRALGCQKVFAEQVSSVAPRAALAAALDFLREGDTLVVTKLDRLARSTVHLGEIVETIEKKEAHLRVANLGLDTSSATSKPTARAKGDEVIYLHRQGVGPTVIAKKLSVSRASVYRILADQKGQASA